MTKLGGSSERDRQRLIDHMYVCTAVRACTMITSIIVTECPFFAYMHVL